MSKIKRFYKRMRKPNITFDEWANAHGIEVSEPKPVFKKPMVSRWVTAAASFMLIVAIILPFAFSRAGTVPDDTHKTYSSQDSASKRLTLEELYDVDELLLFSKNQVVQFSTIGADYTNDSDEILLSYYGTDFLIAASDDMNAFYVNFTIRIYHNYEFYSHLYYSDLLQSLLVGNTTVQYKIKDDVRDDILAYLNFTYNDLEYFLEVKGFEDVTELTEDTLKILLNDLIK